MKKILKITLCSLGLLALFVISGIVGIRVERNRQRALELQKVHVASIAVVNMDNGVLSGDERVNYASQLMSFPNDHFMVTGLTDAKTGIEKGVYAAYIVVPETFSESVSSVEFDPQKVTLNCQYNPSLDEESQLQAVRDVNAFIAQLNSNTAYMYLDAIMAEFHQIQDDSAAILANDNTELDLLASVNAQQLIAVAEPVEEIAVEDNIQPVQLDVYTAQNDVLLDSMMSGYSDAVQRGKEDYAAIQANNSEVSMASDNFFSTYNAVLQDTAAEQASLLTEGRERLDNAVGAYNFDVDAQGSTVRETIVSTLNRQLEIDQASADNQLEGIVQDMKRRYTDRLNALQQQWTDTYQALQSAADVRIEQQLDDCGGDFQTLVQTIYMQGYNNALEDLDEQVDLMRSEADPDVIAVSTLQDALGQNILTQIPQADMEDYIEGYNASIEEQLGSIGIDWWQLGITLPELSGNGNNNGGTGDGNNPDSGGGTEGGGDTEAGGSPDLDDYQIFLTAFDDEDVIGGTVTDTLELFKLKPQIDEIGNVIQTCFVDALAEEGQRQMSRLTDSWQQMNQSIAQYESSLASYNPMQYIENADLGTYLTGIKSNTGDMMNTVQQNNADYMMYAAEMYATTAEHTTELKSSLDEAHTQTAANVESCVDELISSRQTVNNINVNMLKGFTESLNYTRVESQGNAEVYDHIVNPVTSRVNGHTAADAPAAVPEKEISAKGWIILVLTIGILLCLTEMIGSLWRQRKKTTEENGNMY